MFHRSIAPPTGTWRRVRAALMRAPQMSRPLHNEPTIHPQYCTCNDCSLERRRGFRRADLILFAIGIAAAIIAGAASYFFVGVP